MQRRDSQNAYSSFPSASALSSSTSSLPSRKRSTPISELRRRSAEPPHASSPGSTSRRRTPPIHVNGHSYSDDEEEESDDDYDSDDGQRRGANDTETETETETETDGGSGSTTSDEPTVRPTRFSASSTFGDDDMEAEPAREVTIADGEGEGTPEVRRGQHATPKGEGPEDVRMGS